MTTKDVFKCLSSRCSGEIDDRVGDTILRLLIYMLFIIVKNNIYIYISITGIFYVSKWYLNTAIQ
jgi:hypothetical protein